ncbi:unnamed protein product [Arctogadus glacialis]
MHLHCACSSIGLHEKSWSPTPTSKVLGSNGESDGRSILGLCSGAALGCSGLTGRQGNGGPSRGWVPGEGLFFREGSLFGAMLSAVREPSVWEGYRLLWWVSLLGPDAG